jgi:GntR family transcriptional regulator of vanillate catabolism
MQKSLMVNRNSLPPGEKGKNGMQSEADAAASAETQLERATENLRGLVLRGTFPVEVKLAETRVAELLGVSRTPARLAMAALEQDGLLVRLPRRGFRVRSFSLDEVVEAIEVRGELEAVAARIAAERGLAAEHRARMEACIGRAGVLLRHAEFDAARRGEWCRMNVDFHDALVGACGIRPLRAAYAKVNLMPLASPRDIMFNVAQPALTRRQLEATHEDHAHILEAILARTSTRAAALVREHAYRSGANKRRNFPDIELRKMVIETPALIRAGEADAADVA